MKQMRQIRKSVIKLGRVKTNSHRSQRLFGGSRQMLNRFSPRSQRVLVKAKQSFANSSGAWRGHGRYLERDKARSGDGFSSELDKISIPTTLNEWQKAGDQKLHKIIVSPEYAEKLDLKQHTRELMTQMERDLDRGLEWVAIVHKNTDNPHAHIALRGIDSKGRSLDIEGYLGSSLRERSQENTTSLLGPRLYPEILERRNKELFVERLTDIDRSLLWKADENSIVKLYYNSRSNWQRRKTQNQERMRLLFLTSLGLAERVSRDCYHIAPDLREKLRRLSLRELIVRERVPGWEFVRTLKKSGVVRKQLEPGESLTGRVVGTNLRDPFGDRRFMLIEATDGNTYHINQPGGARAGRIAVDDVVTLERRVVEAKTQKLFEPGKFEFTAVQVHPNWKKCLSLDYEAVEILQGVRPTSASLNRVGFAKRWHDAVFERVGELQGKKINPKSGYWKLELAAIRFEETGTSPWEWKPRSYLDLGESSIRVAGEHREASKSRGNSIVVGEIKATSEERILVQDVRDGIGRIITLSDVGLSWPPSVGSMVSVAAKRLPHTEIRPVDEKIAELVSESGRFSDDSLSFDERKFVLSRANTWVRWKILKQDIQGRYRLSEDYGFSSKAEVIELMKVKLVNVRAQLQRDAYRQPAWLKQLDRDSMQKRSDAFCDVDRLLKECVSMSEKSPSNWLTKSLRKQKDIWKQRGVKVDKHFEKNAKDWLARQKSIRVERDSGQILDLSH